LLPPESEHVVVELDHHADAVQQLLADVPDRKLLLPQEGSVRDRTDDLRLADLSRAAVLRRLRLAAGPEEHHQREDHRDEAGSRLDEAADVLDGVDHDARPRFATRGAAPLTAARLRPAHRDFGNDTPRE